MQLAHSHKLPFHTVTKSDFSAPDRGASDPLLAGYFASPDALLTPHYMALTALDSAIKIEPAWKVAIVYGMPCAIYH